MELFAGIDGLSQMLFVLLVALGAGVVKGAVGFAMPMILISGLTLLLPPDVALAALILPTLLTNGLQALRQGWASAWETMKEYWLFLLFGGATLMISAQFVLLLDPRFLYAVIGVPVVLFTLSQLAGWVPKLTKRSRKIEAAVGTFAGFVGGLSGVWGPPTVAYLTAIDVPKREHIRAQGVIYSLGAVLLMVAHTQSGVLREDTWALSFAILPPALVGLWLGFKLQDRLDQATFKKATLIVLFIAGVNLVRRALFG